MKQNLTVQLDEEVVHEAKVLAAHKHTSVSGLIAQQIQELTAVNQRYERAKQAALQALAQAEDRGGRSWNREDLYDR